MTHDPFPLRGVDGVTFAQRRAERDRAAASSLVAQKRRDAVAHATAQWAEREKAAARPLARLKRWIGRLC